MTTSPDPTLVVGAGQAGISLVTRLRELGDDRPIVLVGDEPEAPYERPPLSKTYLRGEHDRASLTLRDAAWCAAHGVELVTGDAVVSIERDAVGGRAVTESGRELTFARLALTTGATEARLPVDGAELDRVLTLRTVADADRLATALRDSRDVVVVGGGFIGLEVAASARALGCTVTVVEAAERLLVPIRDAGAVRLLPLGARTPRHDRAAQHHGGAHPRHGRPRRGRRARRRARAVGRPRRHRHRGRCRAPTSRRRSGSTWSRAASSSTAGP